ncbi:hypothetical protein DM02DRAFT_616185 [Periconia macrospinosa]|uniref:Uncharacterized protein n=1 Tax=Periconia macrospinosa TaxID=97972 RepID=A0A2V1DIU9_9PLEO|nr:hypothetical protein DM02DRAFT_616185 [Periconia macrospinosa]
MLCPGTLTVCKAGEAKICCAARETTGCLCCRKPGEKRCVKGQLHSASGISIEMK